MNIKFGRQTITALVFGVMLLFFAFGHADAFQYAWGENVGWLNLEPLGREGPGVVMGETGLTGHIWGENIGWINLSCENVIDANDKTCAEIDYGVTFNSLGRLSGYAWGENVGWINFAPAGGGVTVDSSRKLSGLAWGENIGWILFNNG